ncbi:MAG: ABC transporter permease subunit [Gammaproteobacteria bacterium]|jgi:oligopeptide transport system permease protein|nr:ABC transporter permease subunit [Gammaproteobacteria bacterium]
MSTTPVAVTHWRAALARLAENRAAMAAAVVLVLVCLAVLVGPWLVSATSQAVDWDQISTPPSLHNGHLLGTDANGRDLLARMLMGGRISLAVGLLATLVSVLIGVIYGATAGYLGGRVDQLMMRAVDVLYALPFLFLVILLTVYFGRHIMLIFLAIGAINWLDMSRIVRGQAMSLKRQEFVLAAQATGVSSAGILLRHILPNLTGIVVVYATLTVPQVILAESFLSFLGLGVQEPLTSWGSLISEGAREMENAPWMLVYPGLVLGLTLLCLNFLGDGLRDALDPMRDDRRDGT